MNAIRFTLTQPSSWSTLTSEHYLGATVPW